MGKRNVFRFVHARRRSLGRRWQVAEVMHTDGRPVTLKDATGDASACFQREVCGQRHVTCCSCGNRHCPACQGDKARQWLDTQLERLLPCPYFLVTFTVPQELRHVIRAHPRECYQALFDTAAATLIAFAQNRKYLGPAEPQGASANTARQKPRPPRMFDGPMQHPYNRGVPGHECLTDQRHLCSLTAPG